MFDYFFDIEEWMVIGSMSEEMAEEEQEQKRIEKDYENDNEDQTLYLTNIEK